MRTELEPDGLTQPSGSSAIMRLARMDLPEPGPPHLVRVGGVARVVRGAW